MKNFSNLFNEIIEENVNSRPVYKNSQNNRVIKKFIKGKRVEVDNRFIVLYIIHFCFVTFNLTLIKKFLQG